MMQVDIFRKTFCSVLLRPPQVPHTPSSSTQNLCAKTATDSSNNPCAGTSPQLLNPHNPCAGTSPQLLNPHNPLLRDLSKLVDPNNP